MPSDLGQFGPLAAALGAGWAGAWAFAIKVFIPMRVKVLESEIEMLKRRMTEMEQKADKWDRLNERLAGAKLATLE